VAGARPHLARPKGSPWSWTCHASSTPRPPSRLVHPPSPTDGPLPRPSAGPPNSASRLATFHPQCLNNAKGKVDV
jgi:hypothetical protein